MSCRLVDRLAPCRAPTGRDNPSGAEPSLLAWKCRRLVCALTSNHTCSRQPSCCAGLGGGGGGGGGKRPRDPANNGFQGEGLGLINFACKQAAYGCCD